MKKLVLLMVIGLILLTSCATKIRQTDVVSEPDQSIEQSSNREVYSESQSSNAENNDNNAPIEERTIIPDPVLPTKADSLENFIPEDWVVADINEFEIIYTWAIEARYSEDIIDINNDGIEDIVCIIEHKDNIAGYLELYDMDKAVTPRILFVAFGEPDGGYTLSFQTTQMMIHPGDQQQFGGEHGMIVSGNLIHIYYSKGNATHNYFHKVLQYKNNEWYVVEDEIVQTELSWGYIAYHKITDYSSGTYALYNTDQFDNTDSYDRFGVYLHIETNPPTLDEYIMDKTKENDQYIIEKITILDGVNLDIENVKSPEDMEQRYYRFIENEDYLIYYFLSDEENYNKSIAYFTSFNKLTKELTVLYESPVQIIDVRRIESISLADNRFYIRFPTTLGYYDLETFEKTVIFDTEKQAFNSRFIFERIEDKFIIKPYNLCIDLDGNVCIGDYEYYTSECNPNDINDFFSYKNFLEKWFLFSQE